MYLDIQYDDATARYYPPDNITKTNAQVVANTSIHSNLVVGDRVIWKYKGNSLLAPFAFQQYSVTSEQLQLVHFGLKNKWPYAIKSNGVQFLWRRLTTFD